VDWILICELCKFDKYICYNFTDIKFFIGVTFLARPVGAAEKVIPTINYFQCSQQPFRILRWTWITVFVIHIRVTRCRLITAIGISRCSVGRSFVGATIDRSRCAISRLSSAQTGCWTGLTCVNRWSRCASDNTHICNFTNSELCSRHFCHWSIVARSVDDGANERSSNRAAPSTDNANPLTARIHIHNRSNGNW